MEKERSPKLVILSILLAGSVVKNCRTVSINLIRLLSCAISVRKEEESKASMHIAA